MKRLLAICFLIVGICCNVFSATAPTQSPKSFIERSGKLYHIASLYPGVNVNDASSDQTGIANLLADTSIKNIYFPPGDYTLPSSFNNSVSNRTFWWDAGARVIGVLHLAIGATSTDTVRNITSIGIPVVTSRVGTYNCKNVNADGFIVGDSSGGGTGVHIYKGSRDVHIGKLYIRNTPGNIYALGIDQDSTGLAYEPSNITIDEVIIDDADSSAIRMANTRYVTLGKVTIRGYDILDGIKLFNTNWTTIKELYISGVNTTTSGVSALNMENDTGSYIGLARIDVDSVTNTAITVSGGFQTAIGMAFLTSTDTVGSKFGLFVNNSKQFRADYVYAKGFNQGIRLVSDTIIRIDDMMLESNKIGYVGSLDTALTFSSITYLNNTDTATGTVPSLTAGVKGGLSGPGSSVSGINIVGSGQLGDISADSVQPKDGITSGFLRLIANNGTAARGSGIYFGSTLSTIERIYAGIHPFLYTGADSGQGGISFLVRKSQTDSTLKRVFICRYDGRLCIGVDTATEYRLPIARPTYSGKSVLMGEDTTGNARWYPIDSIAGGGGGSGDDVKVDTTLASGGEFDPTAPVFKVDSGLGLNRVGSTDSIKIFLKTGGILKGHFDTTSFGYVFDTAIAKSAVFTSLVQTRGTASTDTVKIGGNGQNPSVVLFSGTTGKIHFVEDGLMQWIYSGDSLNGTADSGVITGLRLLKVGASTLITDGTITTTTGYFNELRPTDGSALPIFGTDSSYYVSTASGDCIFSIRENGDTTFISSCDNSTLSINQPSLLAIDSAGVTDLYIDTNGFHMVRFPRSKPTNGYMLSYVDIAGDVDTMAWIAPAGGGGSGDIEGVTAGTGITGGGTTGTVTLNAVGGYGLFTGADSLSVDTVSSTGVSTKANVLARITDSLPRIVIDTAPTGVGTGIFIPDKNLVIRQHSNASIDFQIKNMTPPDADTLLINVATAGITTNELGTNSVRTLDLADSSVASSGITGIKIDPQVIDKSHLDTTASNFVFDDAYHITSAVADSEYASIYYVRTKIGDTAAVLRTYVLAQIADSLADIDSTNINNGGASFPSDLAAFTSTEFFAKVTGETGSGAVVGGTSPTIDAPTVTTSFTGNVLDSANVKANSLDSQDIKNDAIRGSGREILEASIDSTDLANNSVGTTEVAGASLDSTDLANNSVGATEIADGTITRSDRATSDRQRWIWLDLPQTGHYAGNYEATLAADSSFKIKPGFSISGLVADTTYPFLFADSSPSSSVSYRINLWAEVPTAFHAESLYICLATNSTTLIDLDTLQLNGDTLGTTSPPTGAMPHIIVDTNANITPGSTLTPTTYGIRINSADGRNLFAGGRIRLYLKIDHGATNRAMYIAWAAVKGYDR